MKKLLLGITVLALVLFASSTMAQTAKVPKALCVDYASYSDVHQLVIKALGSIQSSDGNVKMYTISGTTIYNVPVAGSGYVRPGTTIFHATFSGMGNSTYNTCAYELVFNLAANTGTIYFQFNNAGGSSDIVNGVACSSLPIIGAMDASMAGTAAYGSK